MGRAGGRAGARGSDGVRLGQHLRLFPLQPGELDRGEGRRRGPGGDRTERRPRRHPARRAGEGRGGPAASPRRATHHRQRRGVRRPGGLRAGPARRGGVGKDLRLPHGTFLRAGEGRHTGERTAPGVGPRRRIIPGQRPRARWLARAADDAPARRTAPPDCRGVRSGAQRSPGRTYGTWKGCGSRSFSSAGCWSPERGKRRSGASSGPSTMASQNPMSSSTRAGRSLGLRAGSRGSGSEPSFRTRWSR